MPSREEDIRQVFSKSFAESGMRVTSLSVSGSFVEGEVEGISFRCQVCDSAGILYHLQAKGGRGKGGGYGGLVVGRIGQSLGTLGKECLGINEGSGYWEKDHRFRRYDFPITHVWEFEKE